MMRKNYLLTIKAFPEYKFISHILKNMKIRLNLIKIKLGIYQDYSIKIIQAS